MSLLAGTLAQARLRKHALRSTSVAIVVALALLSIMTLQGISHSTANSLVTYSLSGLPAGDRAITISSNRVFNSAPDHRSVEAYLAKKLSNLSSGELFPEVLYHELSDSHGVGFNFGAVDGVAKLVDLKSGRLPRTCNPTRCEVLQIGGESGSAPRPDSIGLVVVGKGTFHETKAFTGTFAVSTGVAILVADGITAATSLSGLANRQGSDGWVGEINLKSIENSGLQHYLDSVLAFENELSISHPELTATWPEDALSATSTQTGEFLARFDLLSNIVWALLIAFLILFSLRHRREYSDFLAGLSRIGTPKKILIQGLAIEFALPLVLGAMVTLPLSLFLPRLLSVLHFQANLQQIYHGWPKNSLLLLVAYVLTTGTALFKNRTLGKVTWVPFAIMAPLAVGYFADGREHDQRVWSIPLGYLLASVVFSYFSLQLLISIWRKGDASTYILLRENIGRWQGLAAIFAITTFLAVMTLSFSSGIQQSARTRAQDEVPLDVSIKTGASLARPLDIAGISDYERLLPGSRAYPVLRFGSSVRSDSAVSETLSVIGVMPAALSEMADASLRGLSKTIAPANAVDEWGMNIGSGSRMEVDLAHIPKEIDLLAWFRTPHGTHLSLTFVGHGEHRVLSLAGRVPRDSIFVAFELRETSDYLSRRLHAMGEGTFSVAALKGVGSILEVTVDGQPKSLPEQDWRMRDFPYLFDGGSLFIRPAVPVSTPIVIVDPETAQLATNGILAVTGGGDSKFPVRVGAVRSFFPSAGSHFVIMELNQLQEEIWGKDPGVIDPLEVWISTKQPIRYQALVKSSSLQGLNVHNRVDVLARIEADPMNTGLDRSYQVALLLGLLIAIFMHGSSLPLLRRENSSLLFELEVAGVGPRAQRKAMRRSLRFVLLTGMSIGFGTGIALSRINVSSSTPFVAIALTLISAAVLSEASGYSIARRFFTDSTMVEA